VPEDMHFRREDVKNNNNRRKQSLNSDGVDLPATMYTLEVIMYLAELS
jgi:hypothetical protein